MNLIILVLGFISIIFLLQRIAWAINPSGK